MMKIISALRKAIPIGREINMLQQKRAVYDTPFRLKRNSVATQIKLHAFG